MAVRASQWLYGPPSGPSDVAAASGAPWLLPLLVDAPFDRKQSKRDSARLNEQILQHECRRHWNLSRCCHACGVKCRARVITGSCSSYQLIAKRCSMAQFLLRLPYLLYRSLILKTNLAAMAEMSQNTKKPLLAKVKFVQVWHYFCVLPTSTVSAAHAR